MTAQEIRNYKNGSCSIEFFAQEIAAQLAEMNSHLLRIGNFLSATTGAGLMYDSKGRVLVSTT